MTNINILENISKEEFNILNKYLTFEDVEKNKIIIEECEHERSMYFIIDGNFVIKKGDLEIGKIKKGSHFGELSLISGRPRSASIISMEKSKIAKLSLENYNKFIKEEPELALKIISVILNSISINLVETTDSLDHVLQKRTLPRKIELKVKLENNEEKYIKTGTYIKEVLPERINNYPVIAAFMNNKISSLNEQILSEQKVIPITVKNWEGERILRRSCTILLFEALYQLFPEIKLEVGISAGSQQWINICNSDIDLEYLCNKLNERMNDLIKNKVSFREEIWNIDEAISYFQERNDNKSVKLLKLYHQKTINLVTCGQLYFISLEPLLSDAGKIEYFSLTKIEKSLILNTRKQENNTSMINSYATIMRNHQLWLQSLGINSIGDFNLSCIYGKVSDLIKVSEGYHEKNFIKIADKIQEESENIKVICIAGPSSSGKTTFIKRLSVQLIVNGLNPIPISLDDYYKDREETPKDENGEYDFECIEAIDLDLLREQLFNLTQGKTVKIAKYDFKSGKSIPNGGKEISLSDKDILLLEGIHGLNPNLLGDYIENDKIFKIFIQPMTSLCYDNNSRINPSDLRLIRRIVRDRHQRGCSPEDNIKRWKSVRRGEQKYIFPYVDSADIIFDTSLIYELSVLKVFAERYLLEVPQENDSFPTAYRLFNLLKNFVAIYPDHVPPNSIIREFIGGSSFEY